MKRDILKIIRNFKEKNFYLICFYSLILVFFEIFSIALIFPLLLLVFNQENQIILLIENFFINKDLIIVNFFITFSIFVFLVYLFRFFVFNYLSFIILNYQASIQKFFSKLALEMFLKGNYLNFKNQKSHQFLVLISKETEKFSKAVIALLNFFTESLIIISLILLLFYHNFTVTLYILVVSFLILIITKFILNPFVKKWGNSHIFHDIQRSTTLSEIYNLYKEITIFFKFTNFKKKFSFDNSRTQIAIRNRSFFILLIRSSIEIIIISAVIICLIIISLKTQNLEIYIPLVSFFFLSMLRMLPSLSKFISNQQTIIFSNRTIKFHLEIVKFLKKRDKFIFKDKKVKSFEPKRENLLKIHKLSFKYGTNYVLKNINIKFNENSIIGIKGESGSGKTTFIEILLGLLKPTKGQIFFNDIDIFKNKVEWLKNVGYVSQDNNLFVGSILQNISFEYDLKKINKEKVIKLIKKFNINLYNKFKKKLNQRISFNSSNLSGGEKQRISILRGLYWEKKIIILDEATSALDSQNELKILKELRKFKKNRIIILVSHKLSSLKMCDQIIEIKNNRIKKI